MLLLLVGTYVGSAVAAKCGTPERSWSLSLVSITCTRDGTDCASGDTGSEGGHWETSGTLTSSPDSDTLWLEVREDGRIVGELSEVSP